MKYIKTKIMKYVVRYLVKFLKFLPRETLVIIKGKLKTIGKMDFAEKEILMLLESRTQIRRTKNFKEEPETIQWIKDFLKEGEVLYDVGANVGAYSFIAWALTHGKCKVYAIEPSFSTFASLCGNIILNKAQNEITPLYVALCEETRMLNFYYANTEPGRSLHTIETEMINLRNSHPETYLAMPCSKLDDLIVNFQLAKPNHLKIDVDGVELDILRGAQLTLKSPLLRSILIEINSRGKEIDNLLKKHGFNLIHDFGGRGNHLYAR